MTHSKFRTVFATAALMVSAVSIAAAQHLLADVTGKWTVTGDSPNGVLQSAADYKQDGETLTGTINIPELGASPLTGTVKGDTIAYSFALDVQGNTIQVFVSGLMTDKDNMAGTITLPQDMGSYAFTSKRNSP